MSESGPRRRGGVGSLLAFALSLGAVLALTLLPSSGKPETDIGLCVLCGSNWLADGILNVALFVPLGAALAAGGRGVARVLAIGLLFSTAIEVAQLYIPGRSTSLQDVLTNGAGAALGAAMLRWAPLWLRPPGRWRSVAGWAALLAGLGVVVLGGWLRTPAPVTGTLRFAWEPTHGGEAIPYGGRLLDAFLGSRTAPNGAILTRIEQGRATGLLASDTLRLAVLWKGVQPGERSLFALVNEQGNDVEALSLDGRDLRYSVRSRGSRIALDETTVRLRAIARSSVRASTLDVELAGTRDVVCAFTTAARERCRPLVPLGRGWTLLERAKGLPRSLLPVLDGIWLAGLFLPAGLWLSRDRWVAAALLVPLLIWLPGLVGMGEGSPRTIACALGGLLLGWAAQSIAGRRIEVLRLLPAASGAPVEPGWSPLRTPSRHRAMRR